MKWHLATHKTCFCAETVYFFSLSHLTSIQMRSQAMTSDSISTLSGLGRRSLVFTRSMFSITSPFDSCQNRPPGGVGRLIFIFPHPCVFVYVTPLSKFPSLLIVSAPKLCSCSPSLALNSWPPSTEGIAATQWLEATKYKYFVTNAVV